MNLGNRNLTSAENGSDSEELEDSNIDADYGITKAAATTIDQIQQVLGKLLSARDVEQTSEVTRADLDSFLALLEPFQELPQLLDQYLVSWITQLTDAYLLTKSQWTCHVLYTLTKIRGAKVISQQFPSKVELLDQICQDLENESNDWQTQYILLLWLSILILVPFELVSFAQDMALRLYDICMKFITVSGKQRDGAAIALARLITRNDIKNELLPKFFENRVMEISWKDQTEFCKMGILQTSAKIFQICDSKDVEPYVGKFVNQISASQTAKNESVSSLYQKLVVKNIGRIAVIILNLSDEVSEDIEIILDELLEFLGHRDTVVRYSASKALARILLKLPTELRNQVIEAILTVFDDDIIVSTNTYYAMFGNVSSSRWHGALLCLAEIIRRQCLDPKYLIVLIDALQKSLYFEQRKLTYAVGANVRDASCYVCWSLFRTYRNLDYEVVVSPLFESLTCIGCFDREVNVRRAAAAAIQEGVGRQLRNGSSGKHNNNVSSLSVQNGIQLVQNLDYFHVGLRRKAYLEVAPLVFAQGYSGATEFLIYNSVRSWDASVRRLAGRALLLLSLDSRDHWDRILNLLINLQKTDESDRELQHGAFYALGEVFSAKIYDGSNFLPLVRNILETVTIKQLRDENESINCEGFLHLFNAFLQQLLSTGASENLNPLYEKLTVCFAINSNAEIVAEVKTLVSKLTVVEVSTNIEPTLIVPRSFTQNWIEGMFEGQGSFTIALGNLQNPSADILDALTRVASKQVAFSSPEIRRDAITSLGTLLGRNDFHIKSIIKEEYYAALLEGLDDYSTDSRGDVGSWIRLASINSCLTVLNAIDNPNFLVTVIQRLVRISVEILDKLRLTAFEAIIQCGGHVADIIRTNLINFDETERSASVYFGHMLTILNHNTLQLYKMHLLKGYVTTAGAQHGSGDILRISMEALIQYLRQTSDTQQIECLDQIMTLMDFKTKISRYSNGALAVFGNLFTAGFDFPAGLNLNKLYIRTYNAHINTNDVHRILKAVEIFAGLASLGNKLALRRLGVLLEHRFPRVRMFVAEALYGFIISMSEDESILNIMELMEDINW